MLLLISILMKKKLSDHCLSEEFIIDKLFKKLNYNKLGTFNFENDGAYLNLSKKYQTVVTTDTITENVDFFSKDPPESIAQKILCVNLSDLSAMGSLPKAYTLNISINSYIDFNWLKKFTNKLSRLQKKYNIYCLGGDFSKSKEISITSTFFGQAKSKNILPQNKCQVDDDIWVTGNLGDSYIGYKLCKSFDNKIDKKNILSFKKKYLYPTPCMFGYMAAKYINSAKDISDGFFGDLKKILNKKYGAKINLKSIPLSNNLKKILSDSQSKIYLKDILCWGDDFELIFTSKKKYKGKLLSLAKKNNIKLSNIGSVIMQRGVFDDSALLIKNISSYDHFR
jgi:thiamine-monophosphate kinase